jgi:F-type H+-transporting ATPase subunit gamma
VVCTAERGLCGAFNSSIARLARDKAQCAFGRRQDGQDHLRRQEGFRHPAPRLRESLIIDRCRSARGQDSSASSMPMRSPRRSSTSSTRASFDVCTLFYSQFKSVISADPDRAADHSPALIRLRPKTTGNAVYDYEPAGRDPLRPAAAQHLTVQVFRALLENAASERARKMSAMDRDAQRRRHDQQADDHSTTASGRR